MGSISSKRFYWTSRVGSRSPKSQWHHPGRQQPFGPCRDMLIERTRRYVKEIDTLRTVYGPEIAGSQEVEDFTKMLLEYQEVDVRCEPPMQLIELDTPLLHVDTTTHNDSVCATIAAAMTSPSPSSSEDESPEGGILPGDWRFPFFYNMCKYNDVVRDELEKEEKRRKNPPPSLTAHRQFGGEGPVVSDSPVDVSPRQSTPPCQSNPACEFCPACYSRQSNTLHLPYRPNPSYALITPALKDSRGSSCEGGAPAMNQQSENGAGHRRAVCCGRAVFTCFVMMPAEPPPGEGATRCGRRQGGRVGEQQGGGQAQRAAWRATNGMQTLGSV